MESFDDGVLVRVVPLGGLGHIGGNMMVYETAHDLIVVDCGVLFPTPDQHGIDYVIPDVRYVAERRHKLRGYVITHGHEDHIGALPWVLPDLPAPVFATRFTEALLHSKLAEHPHIKADLRPLRDRTPITLGRFRIEPLAVTHSIPDAVALAIDTPAGVLLHTGDFKIDPDPVDGRATDLAGLRGYGDRGVTLLLSDSTNAEKGGHTWGEREVASALHDVIAAAPGRVFLTTFASHIDRIQAVLSAAERTHRRVIPAGRSMQQNIEMGLEKGFLRASRSVLAEPQDFTNLAARRVVVLASGSQGEPQSAMARIADGRYSPIVVDPGDRVIMSSRRIPGNERNIGRMVNSLYRKGAEVLGDHDARVHSSGHAFNDEQLEMIGLCRPKFFVPLHGELRHMVRHAALATQAGVEARHAMVTEDGQPLVLRQVDGVTYLQREEPVPAGLVMVDGKGVGDVGEVVLRDRRLLSESGIIVCVLVFSGDGRLVRGPELATRGLVYVDQNLELLHRCAKGVQDAIGELAWDADTASRGEAARLAIRRFFKRELERRPLIVPIVLELPARCHCD